jgi:SNF2 family DNA or RNA helicase
MQFTDIKEELMSRYGGYDFFEDSRTPSRAKDAITARWNWEELFDKDEVAKAKSPELQKSVTSCRDYNDGYIVEFGRKGYVRIDRIPKVIGQNLDPYYDCFCNITTRSRSFGFYNTDNVFIPAALCYLEDHLGPFMLTESVRNYEQRKKEEETKKLLESRRQYREKKGRSVQDFLLEKRKEPKTDLCVLIDVPGLAANMTASDEVIRAAEELEKQANSRGTGSAGFTSPTYQITEKGQYELTFGMSTNDDYEYCDLQATIRGNRLMNVRYSLKYLSERGTLYEEKEYIDSVKKVISSGTGCIDEYLLFFLWTADQLARPINQGNSTSSQAQQFLESVTQQLTSRIEESTALPEKVNKTADIELEPRLVLDIDGSLKLSFKIGRTGGRKFIVKNIMELLHARENSSILGLGKSESIDFSKEELVPGSEKIVEYLMRRAGTIGAYNEQLQNKSRYYYTDTVDVSKDEALTGTALDRFYETAEGMEAELQNKRTGEKTQIEIAHDSPKVNMQIDRISDLKGDFAGVQVHGTCPVLLHGTTGSYVLTGTSLSRATPEEKETLEPFQKVSASDGSFRFQVGRTSLQEFYYRALPAFLQNPAIDVTDNCEEDARSVLPPEPEFTFYMDFNEDVILCRPTVRYNDRELNLRSRSKGYRDMAQEKRILDVVTGMFPEYDGRTSTFYEKMDDDRLYRFLMSDLQRLSEYGTVRGTDAFKKLHVVRSPQVSIGVSVDVGLTDLDITSKDVSKEELLDILRSYQLKKRYHRLKSGDFVDLRDAEQLEELQNFLRDLDLDPEKAIRGKTKIPQYRALYVDKLLEQHDALIAERSRTMRRIVKNFTTIRDADYEAPPEVAEKLRPYQEYGFKWLETLEKTGFGGILADDMGLGKTLQMIAVFAYDRFEEGAEGKHRTSLVVCPASLVYNWQEEIARFAPDLSVAVIAGTMTERREMLQHLSEADVAITSYELLKRDIASYSGITFHILVIDEAQYIKNTKAAQTKAVKTIQAQHRFALTGTPIENRLSELWSIFDFLMPGLLYSSAEFEEKFERPIAKNKDEDATRKLRAMTGPFILRRKKEDVLKDLPAKLEEVRYARLSGEQQKLYDAQVAHMKKMLRTDMDKNEVGRDKIRILAELTRIREVCCDPSLVFENYTGPSAKREAVLDLIESAMSGGHRMLVFSQFTSMLELLEKDLSEREIPYYEITGNTPKDKRLMLVHEFNEGDVPVFLISLKAGGTGLNLTGADVVIHYDPWWNLAAQNQATDRAHRIGQTRQVTVYRMIAKGTIEEKILELQEAKKDLAEAILEGESSSIMSLSGEELLALLDE